MEYSQIITSAIALIAAFISFVSLHRSGKVQRQQLRLQEKQEEHVTLQLEMLRKQAAAAAIPSAEKADVRVNLEKYGRDHKFMITNWGSGPARNVKFDVKPKEGKVSPLIESDYKDKIPIRQLATGGRVPLFAALTFGTGITFDCDWSWENSDGSVETRSSVLSL